MKTFIFIVALLVTYSIAIADDNASSTKTTTTISTDTTATTTTPSSPEKCTSKKRNPSESEEKSTCSNETTSITRTVPEGVLNLIKFFSKQNTKTVNNPPPPPPPSVTLTNSSYGTLFTYKSSSGGETIIHKPAPIIVKRPPTNLVIKHPPIVVKPAPVIFHKPPPIMHRQFFYKPLPPSFNLNNCHCNTFPIKQINSKSIHYKY